MALGAATVAYGLFSSLELLKQSLGFLSYDGYVGRLSAGETALLRTLAVLTGLALAAAGPAWPVLTKQTRATGKSLLEWLALLNPQACLRALRRLAAKRGTPYAFALVLVFTAGVAVRTAHLQQPMHDDEAGAFLNWSHQPLYISFATYGSPGNHVLHTGLVALSYRLFGDSTTAIRLPAFGAGIGLMVATFVLFLRMFGPWPALLALSMIAASDTCAEYGANARGYSLAALLGLWQTHALLAALPRRDWRPWLLPAVPAALGIYVIPTMVYLPMALCVMACVLCWWEHGRDRTRLFRPLVFGVVVLGIAAALYSPIVFVGGFEALTNTRFYAPLTLGEWLGKAGAVTCRTIDMISAGVMPAALLVPLTAVGFVLLRRVERGWLVLWTALFLVPLMTSFAQRVVPFARTFAYLQPFVYALVGLAVWELLGGLSRWAPGSRRLRPAAALLVCGVMLLSVGGKFARADRGFFGPVEFPQAQPTARLVADRLPAEVSVFILDPCRCPFQYYLDRIEGMRRQVDSRVPEAPPAVWVRYAGAPVNLLYRRHLNELCTRFRVGPVLHRVGKTEIVALSARPEVAGQQVEGHPPTRWGD